MTNYGKTFNYASGFQGKVHLLVIIVSQKFVLVGILVPKATKCDTLLTESAVSVLDITLKLLIVLAVFQGKCIYLFSLFSIILIVVLVHKAINYYKLLIVPAISVLSK